MMMDVYFEKMKETLGVIEKTQRENIILAAKAVADSLENGGMWHVLDTGHMLMHEGVGRTGGMMALKPIMVTCEVNNPTRPRKIPGKSTTEHSRFSLISPTFWSTVTPGKFPTCWFAPVN